MQTPFDEKKATEAAALLLNLRGGRMHYIKLIKLLYLADREALKRWGFAITTDHYASMDHGPVVSNIYNLIVNEGHNDFWREYISAPLGEYEVELLQPHASEKLSLAEEKLLREIFNQYGSWNRWALIDQVMHKLPEWSDPHGSSTPITVVEILRAQGEDEETISVVEREIELAGRVEATLQGVA